MRKTLISLFVLAMGMSPVASATIISHVDRSGGATHSREPIGAYTGDTDPLAGDPGGLDDGSVVFSDRVYTYAFTPDALRGAEYIRTFNQDKHHDGGVVYAVSLSTECTYAIAIDDRFGGSSTLQFMVDAIAPPSIPDGTFVNSGLDLTIHEQNLDLFRSFSVFTATLPSGSYNFTGNGFNGRRNFMVMAAFPEPATLLLLGLGAFVLRTRR